MLCVLLCSACSAEVRFNWSLCGSRGVERSCDKRGEAHAMESQAGGKGKKSAGSSGALPSNPKAAKKLKGVKKLLSSNLKGKKRKAVSKLAHSQECMCPGLAWRAARSAMSCQEQH